MKFNLENRPKLHGLKGSTHERFQQLFEQVEKTEGWFSGFGKELRERILGFPENCQQCKNYNQQKMECRLLACPYITETAKIFREILGDEQE